MKLKALLFVSCFGLLGSSYAENHHVYPKADAVQAQASTQKGAMLPGYCEIEVINSSFDNVTVYGTFDDGTTLTPFDVYTFESPHYIDLFYYGYCHKTMYLDIVTFSGYHIYSGYTRVNSTVRIVPYLNKQPKFKLESK
ncbi:hypothetical protein Lqui_0004 [Legionella quinlivanii]|uniref:Secreted protein n=1 Tax=Legionella quinlivanii TaxID=45073 RepID=A0A0W0Y7Q8_9GAMM|nr:hypothetical protein [Legionella quinlivanii]KTD53049.1 hypothetical protein Lqui_0004 [Legionella quinlivanii]MCW8451373.1 hypothetical protein [Legionella quinlivanii]SEG16238.1 hypothetical protein SAMN02746093_02047 [Legionella quinlivanii DSM 21216]STY10429.1 Uncharacterised protein [Legionella quinlivanii]